MRLESEFSVVAPAERAWRDLLDVHEIARCMPGADLRPLEGENAYEGVAAIGGVPLRGTLRVIDADEDAHVVSLLVEGREAGGVALGRGMVHGRVGTANGSTHVALSAEVKLTGLRANSELVEHVGAQLLDDFARRLGRRMLSDDVRVAPPEPAAPRSLTDRAATSPGDAREGEHGSTRSPPALDRARSAVATSAPFVALAALVALALRRRRHGVMVVIRVRR